MSQPADSQLRVVIHGRIFGRRDGWGNRFPVSETTVLLLTSVGPVINRLGETETAPDGMFSVVSANHSSIIPDSGLFLHFSNKATGNTYDPKVDFRLVRTTSSGVNKRFELKAVETPWFADPPVIAHWKGRQFKYPADFAQNLRAGMGSTGTFEIRFSANAFPPHEFEEIDRLFSILESESKVPKPGVTGKLAAEIAPVLGLGFMKAKSPRDGFRMILERLSNMYFNRFVVPEFRGSQLASAVKRAFDGPTPSFFGLEERAAFCGLIFAAAALEAGSKVSVGFTTTVAGDHVTSVVIG